MRIGNRQSLTKARQTIGDGVAQSFQAKSLSLKPEQLDSSILNRSELAF